MKTLNSHVRLGNVKERVPTSEYNQVPSSDDDLTSTKNRNILEAERLFAYTSEPYIC